VFENLSPEVEFHLSGAFPDLFSGHEEALEAVGLSEQDANADP